MKEKLEITLKITDKDGIIIGRSVILFGKPKYVAGLWNNNSVVFATLEPKTLSETNVLIYTIEELKDLAKDGDLKEMVEL